MQLSRAKPWTILVRLQQIKIVNKLQQIKMLTYFFCC